MGSKERVKAAIRGAGGGYEDGFCHYGGDRAMVPGDDGICGLSSVDVSIKCGRMYADFEQRGGKVVVRPGQQAFINQFMMSCCKLPGKGPRPMLVIPI
jgi:hypothetical protein